MSNPLLPHQDRSAFKDSIRFVEGKTGFSARLIEKDYYCSLVLRELMKTRNALVFKGGTLLNKVHAGFYRLSEDLDFTISTDFKTTRGERSKNAKPLKAIVLALPTNIPGVVLEKSLTGSNESRQYNATVIYNSVLIEKTDSILIEISQREKVHEAVMKAAATLLQDPYTDAPLIPHFDVACLSKGEAYAEKVRAALTRKEAAIRDLYDLDHATRNSHIPLDEQGWLALIKEKFQVSGNGQIQVSLERKAAFKDQLETDLRPVLRDRDFSIFDFESAWKQLERIAVMVQRCL